MIICHDRLPGFLQLLVWFHVIHVNLKSILIGFGIEIGVIFFILSWMNFFLDWRPLNRRKVLNSLLDRWYCVNFYRSVSFRMNLWNNRFGIEIRLIFFYILSTINFFLDYLWVGQKSWTPFLALAFHSLKWRWIHDSYFYS